MARVETSQISGGEFHETSPIPQEIERKFVVATIPDNLQEFPHTFIRQGYLEISDTQEIRVRQAGDEFFRTIKSVGGLSRSEEEVSITEEEFEKEWEKTEGRRVEKTRYKLPFEKDEKLVIELDIYEGDLKEMPAVAEIEFESEKDAKNFTTPLWFGREVTDNAFYRNSYLATNGIPKDIGEKSLKTGESVRIEKSLQDDIDELINIILEKKQTTKGPLIVGLSGRTSSGKSTVIGPVSARGEELGLKVKSLSMDDYSLGNSHIAALAEQGVKINWDHPAYIDFDLLREHISALKRGEAINKPTYSFKTAERDGFEQFEIADIVVVEGLFALRPELQDLEDVKAFIDISLHGSMVRRLIRDVKRTNMDPSQILRYYLETVEPMYQEHIEKTKKNADVVLLNEYNPQNEAGGAGAYEAQTKFQTTIDDETLKNAGAEFLEVVKQEDLYFSPFGKNLGESDESFRIRREGGVRTLSYKGPQMGKTVRVRPKFEFEIDDATEKIFTDKYGEIIKNIFKTRKLYRLGDAIISVDNVTKKVGEEAFSLGDFVEIRCDIDNNEEQMQEVCKKLGLNFDKKINASYSEM